MPFMEDQARINGSTGEGLFALVFHAVAELHKRYKYVAIFIRNNTLYKANL